MDRLVVLAMAAASRVAVMVEVDPVVGREEESLVEDEMVGQQADRMVGEMGEERKEGGRVGLLEAVREELREEMVREEEVAGSVEAGRIRLEVLGAEEEVAMEAAAVDRRAVEVGAPMGGVTPVVGDMAEGHMALED